MVTEVIELGPPGLYNGFNSLQRKLTPFRKKHMTLHQPVFQGQSRRRIDNLSKILFLIKESETRLSRADLGRTAELNKSTITNLVDELISLGLVVEVGMRPTTNGRPSTLLDLNPEVGSLIGIELGVEIVRIVLSDFTGKVLWRKEQVVNPIEKQEAIISQVLDLVDSAISEGKQLKLPPLGIGITLPGLVNVEEGMLIFAPNLSWRNVPFRDIFEKHTGLPVQIENDAHAAALGEHYFGIATQSQNFIFLVLDVGVGGGLLFEGEIFHGAQGFAGQLGHSLFMQSGKRLCRCGNQGCFETTCNIYSVIERMNARIQIGRPSLVTNILQEKQSPLSFSEIIKAAELGDREAQEVLWDTGRAIGIGLVNLVNLFNPEMFVFGGQMSIAGKYFVEEANTILEQFSLSEHQLIPRIAISKFGVDASVMGAVALITRHIILHPRSVKTAARP